MRKTLLAITAILLTAGVTLPAFAQSGQRIVERITPIGIEQTLESLSPHTGSVLPRGSLQAAGGVLWNYPSPSAMPWISNAVAIGQRGTQVIVGEDLNFERVHLFSVDDANPPTSIWADTNLNQPQNVSEADSSHTGDFHVILYRSATNVVVNLYRSSSPVPAWTWSPPFTNVGAARVAIDRQPSVVAVGVVDNTTKQIHLYFLDPRTGAQLNTFAQATQYGLRGWDLSADGSTLYFHDGGYGVNIFDILTNQVVFQTQTGGSFDGHCISGDGTKFAFGGFGHVKIWEKTTSGWQMYNFPTGTGNYGDEMDFSDDGTTLGFGVSQYSPTYGRTEAYMMDVASRKITAHVVNTSNGNYQDVCSAAAISHDGKYFVLGRWGDDVQANPEVQILENGQGLVGSIACRGSCFDAGHFLGRSGDGGVGQGGSCQRDGQGRRRVLLGPRERGHGPGGRPAPGSARPL